MPFLVDGHNLIPHIPGLRLDDLDDERSLLEILVDFANRKRIQVEVYFDKAAPSRAGSQSIGRVKAHFVRQEITADQAIITRLKRLGGSVKNWTVVSSDRVIRTEARSYHSKIMSSEEFAALLLERSESGGDAGKAEDPQVSDHEVGFWLDKFDQH
ncbi:MAG: NYN domain-containing protein [Anaerolineales bacterium]|jgi:predicted RNA-binding protein with PIN domain